MSEKAPNLFAEAARLQEGGGSFALATIVASSGSTPRTSARMIIRADGSTMGTIGGGLVEARVMREAAECLSTGESRLVHYDLDRGDRPDSLQMDCGGSMTIFIEALCASRRLAIVGAGHVGLALADLAARLGFRVAVIDERPELVTPERFPMAGELHCDPDLERAIASLSLDENGAVVIATHASDERALRAFIGRKSAYLGMLGSRRKVSVIFDKLAAEGVDRERLAKIRAPIGIEIGAESPDEIAVSIMAEVMADLKGVEVAHFADFRRR